MHSANKPPSPTGSRLDKYATILRRWRGEGHSDRRIAAKLAEEYRETVSYRTVHHWFNTHTEDHSPLASAEALAKADEGESKFQGPQGRGNFGGGKRPLPEGAEQGEGKIPRALRDTHRATGNRQPTTNDPIPASPSADELTALRAQVSLLEETLAELRDLPARPEARALTPEIAYPSTPGRRSAPRRVYRWLRPVLFYALCLAAAAYALSFLYGLMASHPIMAALTRFAAAPVASSQLLYRQMVKSPIALIECGVLLAGLCLGFRAKTLLLMTLIWFLHVSFREGYLLAFAALLLLTGRVTATLFRQAASNQ